jgi:hypothetical protein
MRRKSARPPADARRVKTPECDVVLWRPRIVVAPTLEAATTGPRRVTLEALASPAGAAVRLDTAQSVLGSLAESARERVIAAMTAYRLEASFDQTLVGTYRQVTALMEERGLA